jgi:hypothetical protein
MSTNSGGQILIPAQSWETKDITSADYNAPTGEDWPIAFIIDTTGAVSFRCVSSGETVTRQFIGGQIHLVGAFDIVYHGATTPTSITVGRP